jgi:cell division protein FtsB
MKEQTKYLILLFLSLEVLGSIGVYMGGSAGITLVWQLDHGNEMMEKKIDELKNENEQLILAIDEWDKYPFYKEKIAREQLQMAAPEDELYVIT